MKDYKDDSVWLMHGDCLERMKEIDSGSVDIVVSDAPYGIDFSGWDVTHVNKNKALLGSSPAQKSSSLFKKRGKPKNGWSEADKGRPKEFQNHCESWLRELYRVTKEGSPILIMTGRQNQHRYTVAAEDTGFVFKDSLIWDKQSAPFRAQNINNVLSKRGLKSEKGEWRLGNLAPIAEPIVWCFKPYKVGTTLTDCFIKDGIGCFNSEHHKSNIISLSSKVESNRLHETQKPIALMERITSLFSQEHHTVLDLFMGSGTTGVACKNLNRKFIGIEMDERYYNIAKDRILTA